MKMVALANGIKKEPSTVELGNIVTKSPKKRTKEESSESSGSSGSSSGTESESESEDEVKTTPKKVIETKKIAVKSKSDHEEEKKMKNLVELNSNINNIDGNSKAAEEGAFENFNLSAQIIEKLKKKNVNYLFPIQIATLKHLREGHDMIAQARTGSGKTLAFAIPIVEKLQANKAKNDISRTPKVLVLEPTRELAKQVGDDFNSISSHLRTCCVYGGVSYYKQENDLRQGVDILAGTPGRILDFINSGKIDLNAVEHVILDEVDRMLDMGFQDSVEEILKNVYSDRPKRAQTLFFSATCPPWVKKTAQKYISADFKFIDLIGDSKLKTSTTVEHMALQCSYHDRASTIGSVLQFYSGNHGRAMIFCQTKKDADELACSSDIKQESHVMHGDVPQDKRELVLQVLKESYLNYLSKF
jgi:ATP-dependent RNA helicase DDX21